MPSFRLTKQAKDDLKSIARYTQEIWGRDQRNKYLGILDNCFHLLADEPDLGVACNEIRKNYRKFCIERHIIFYRKVAEDIDVVRILHCRMDVEKQLFD
ncbi:type II toxin-antitoxin system RelE/ParE family toxin [Methylobacter tundripaludum]|uniref:type II toxin-antitoxin system RelE/ParE family toxin n=1 Tax=Methylobacter tundripaludum TaxID=173365 RepID=UPI0004DED7BA|nr:type II toxin-antitoxin system RelE/ParE family toxin [Methylobacter tundripaludum]